MKKSDTEAAPRRGEPAGPAWLCLLPLCALLAGCGAEPRPDASPAGERGGAEIPPPGEQGAAERPRDFREEVRGLLFEGGTEEDLARARRLVEEAAQAGDPTAALWMGRSLLGEPPDRIRAAAWFLVASPFPGPGDDARGELEALALSPAELAAAGEEADVLRARIGARPEKPASRGE